MSFAHSIATDKAVFLQAVPSLVFWEVRRKDFWESMAHHFATLGLIVYSYQVKCAPVNVHSYIMGVACL